MKVESDSLVFAERAMYFGHDGHDSVGVPAPSRNWYFAEGSTRGGFDTWILIQNPLGTPATVNLTFLTSDGRRLAHSMLVPPNSRRSLYVNDLLPQADVATVISSDGAIVAERAMYFAEGGGHGSFGAGQLSKSWYLPEGQTGDGFDTWLLALNPGETPANVKVTYMLEDGTNAEAFYAVGPGSRLSLYVNEAIPSGRFGTRVDSDQPIVVERSMYFASGRGGHNTAGSPLLAQEWFLPEGSTKPPFRETVAVINPSDRAANLVVTFMRMDAGPEVRYFALNPNSRLTLSVSDLLPDAEVSTKIASDTPIAVERSMYFAAGQGGTSSLGVPR